MAWPIILAGVATGATVAGAVVAVSRAARERRREEQGRAALQRARAVPLPSNAELDAGVRDATSRLERFEELEDLPSVGAQAGYDVGSSAFGVIGGIIGAIVGAFAGAAGQILGQRHERRHASSLLKAWARDWLEEQGEDPTASNVARVLTIAVLRNTPWPLGIDPRGDLYVMMPKAWSSRASGVRGKILDFLTDWVTDPVYRWANEHREGQRRIHRQWVQPNPWTAGRWVQTESYVPPPGAYRLRVQGAELAAEASDGRGVTWAPPMQNPNRPALEARLAGGWL